MIVMISAWRGASECAADLAHATGERVRLLTDFGHAPISADALEADVLVLEERLLSEPFMKDLVRTARGATPVFINLAICGRERLIREVQMAVQRRHHDRLLAMEAAEATLRSEVKSDITGILLAAELALENLELPPEAREKLQQISQLALDLESRVAAQEAPRMALRAAASPMA